jgi:hypothetical protein
MNNTKIELKDLVWKSDNKAVLLQNLCSYWFKQLNYSEFPHSPEGFYFDNAEQIAKEKAEILNKKEQYTKGDIIEMFVEAGFEYEEENGSVYENCNYFKKGHLLTLVFQSNNKMRLVIKLKDADLNLCYIELNYTDRKSIEFYYNKFREILEFEVAND